MPASRAGDDDVLRIQERKAVGTGDQGNDGTASAGAADALPDRQDRVDGIGTHEDGQIPLSEARRPFFLIMIGEYDLAGGAGIHQVGL